MAFSDGLAALYSRSLAKGGWGALPSGRQEDRQGEMQER
jgi:hypothetical protein